MERLEPLKPTFERDEIEERINKLYEEKGEVNREFTEKPSIHDLIYDELRNLNGALASLSAGNEILLKAIVDNTATTADRLGYVRDNTAIISEHLESVDERLVEANNLLTDTRDKKPIVEGDYGEPLMTQKDIDAYMESVKDYYVFDDEDKEKIKGDFDMSSKTKRVKLKSDERHIIYQALGSRASTLRNQIGYTRINDDGTLRDQITKHENLISCLLYTSDATDDTPCVDLAGRRIIKK